MPIYKITLQPLGRFFFGGEIKFADAGVDDRRATYITHSRYFPQQTTLLGMLRLELLLQNGLLQNTADTVKDKTKADRLIGSKGFSANKHDAPFGFIESLSPVFIAGKNGEPWLPAPLDDQPMEKGNMVFTTSNDGYFALKNLNPKTDLHPKLVQANAEKPNCPLSNFFQSEDRIGITKATKPWQKARKEGEEESEWVDDSEGFFKQTSLRFSDIGQGIGYSFFVKMKDEDFLLEDSMVVLGGERSVFKMTLEKEGFTENDLTLPNINYRHTIVEGENIYRVVLMSDAFADPTELKKYSLLTVSKAQSFRFLSVGTNTKFFHALNQENEMNGEGLHSSKLYHLLERGSVIYFKKDNQAIIKTLFDHSDFYQIGYNHYQII